MREGSFWNSGAEGRVKETVRICLGVGEKGGAVCVCKVPAVVWGGGGPPWGCCSGSQEPGGGRRELLLYHTRGPSRARREGGKEGLGGTFHLGQLGAGLGPPTRACAGDLAASAHSVELKGSGPVRAARLPRWEECPSFADHPPHNMLP